MRRYIIASIFIVFFGINHADGQTIYPRIGELMLGAEIRAHNQDDLKSALHKRFPDNTKICVVQKSLVMTMGQIGLSDNVGAALKYTHENLVFSYWISPTDTVAGRRVSVYFGSKDGVLTTILVVDTTFDADED